MADRHDEMINALEEIAAEQRATTRVLRSLVQPLWLTAIFVGYIAHQFWREHGWNLW